MNIIFDLDGTLIDSRKRLYTLFCDLVPNAGLSYDQYWTLKKSGVGHEEILSTLDKDKSEDFVSFNERWMGLIETNRYLILDVPFNGVGTLLAELVDYQHKLYLLTARQSSEKVHMQLQKFGWADYFEKCMITCQKQTKKEILDRLDIPFNSTVMIGDTGADIALAKGVGAYAIGVTSGFHSRQTLMKYEPDAIIKWVTDIEVENPAATSSI